MQSYMGKCNFCGKEVGIMAESQESADKNITDNCSCGGAKLAEKKEDVKNQIETYTGEGCEDEGFRQTSQEVREILMLIGEATVERKIRKAVLVTDGTTITITGGEKVKVKRGYKYEKSSEV